MEHHRAKYDSSPALLEEIPLYKSEEASKTSGVSMVHHAVLHGGRLASIFEMAEKGMLSIASEVTYHSRSPTGDEYEGLDLELLSRLREAVLKEMDCLVCYHTMIHPTTASCGHTFCRRCLLSVMDCTIICPACRQRFNMDRRLLEQRENRCLSELVQSLCPDEISSREQALKEEEQPGAGELDTPLFESRYRLMMRRCIAGNRRFGMLSNNDRAEPQGNLGATPFKEYGCMLEIVNFHLFPDGRSMVETKGLARFRVVDHDMLDGYHVGRVERVDDVSLDQEKRLEASEIENALAYAAAHNSKHSSTALCPANFPDLMSTADLFRYCRQYVATLQARNERDERNRDLNRRVLNWMGPIPTDPAIFPYWFASVLPIEKEEQYQLLRTTTVRERLKIVYIWIRSLEQLPWYVELQTHHMRLLLIQSLLIGDPQTVSDL
jgi:Lon protease-like protein